MVNKEDVFERMLKLQDEQNKHLESMLEISKTQNAYFDKEGHTNTWNIKKIAELQLKLEKIINTLSN